MLKIILPVLVCLFPILTFAETFNLLEIPLKDEAVFVYKVNSSEACLFSGVSEIEYPKLSDKEFIDVNQKLKDTQKEANLEIEKKSISPEVISFSLKGAKNLSFEFRFKDCKISKEVLVDNKRYAIQSIKADYITTLRVPVLERVVIKTGSETPDLILYQPVLENHTPAYTLDAGPGFQIRTNIRRNDHTAFHKHDPAFGPTGVFSFRYGPFFLNRTGIGSLVFNHKELSILVMGILEGEPYESPGLQDRGDRGFVGTLVKLNIFEFTYYNDFFTDRGYNLKLNIAPKFYPTSFWQIKPQAFMQYWDDKYVNHYFGVTKEESVASGFKAYEGLGAINYGAVLEVMRFIDRFTIVGELSAKFYGKEVYTSPTVNNKTEIKLVSGVLYKFF